MSAQRDRHQVLGPGALQEATPDPELGSRLLESLRAAEKALRRDDYRGYDPYDALRSPLFRLPLLRSSHLVRFVAQQAVKRLPFNVRPLLGISKGLNPVSVGLALQGYVNLATALPPSEAEPYLERVDYCVEALGSLASPAWSGACWGYDFDWASRRVSLPAFTPTVVATGDVTNALFAAATLLEREDALALCRSATHFVVLDLNRSYDTEGNHCWSYSPLDRQQVLNASLKGARLCAQVGAATSDEALLSEALSAARYVVNHQRQDGAWGYSVGDGRNWVDHFHTGYVLESLASIAERISTGIFDGAIAAGWDYYRSNLFEDGLPKYYDDRLYPIDATACAQAILTLCAFGDLKSATELAGWIIDTMQTHDGGFVYRVHRRRVDRTHYARWSTAWLFAALAVLVSARRGLASSPLAATAKDS
jgi:hypothetical protein